VAEAWRAPSPAFERQTPARAHESGERVATLKMRFFALLIDSLISSIMALVVMIICVALFALLPYLFSMLNLYYEAAFFNLIMLTSLPVAGIIVTSLINIAFIYKRGQTWGKKIIGLRITSASGRKRSLFRNVILRSLVKILLLVPPLVAIDLCFLLRKDGRTLHDIVGGTIVINER
jgi:uncharacterized RDD family membrane protein YckC